MSDTSPQPNQTPRARGFRWGRLVLVTSLALNLGILGMVVGAAVKGGWHGGEPRAIRDVGFGPFTRALTEDDRKMMRRAFMANAPDMRATRQSLQQDMAALLAALRAAPFDPAALADALRQTTERARQRQEIGEKLLLDFVAALPDAERLAFADRLETGLTRQRAPDDRLPPQDRERRREP
tara:strand:+ start:103 stop:645 length:543 start_codon:yes stop_codon:yes gene_type:complete